MFEIEDDVRKEQNGGVEEEKPPRIDYDNDDIFEDEKKEEPKLPIEQKPKEDPKKGEQKKYFNQTVKKLKEYIAY